MIKHGVLPNKYDPRDFSHERTFGAVDPKYFPDEYNADLGLSFPDQNADGLPNACTGYTQSEIGQDENGELFDPRFTYEKTLAIENAPPGSPCQMRDSFKSTRTFGLKRKENESTVVRGAYFDVDKAPDYFDGARSALWMNSFARRTISAATPWVWQNVGHDGIMGDFSAKNLPNVWHNFKVCGWKTIKNEPYLIIKPWTGPKWGDHGYGYVSRSVWNKVMGISGTAMYIQSNLSADEVVRVKLDIYQLILDFALRLLLKIGIMPSNDNTTEISLTTPSQRLYDASYACIGKNMRSGAAPQEFGCVDAFRGVYREAFGADIAPDVLDTNGLNAVLSQDKRFRAVLDKELIPGDIRIALTVGDVHGHVCVRGKQDSMSNDSDSGLWKANYHNDNFDLVFKNTLGLKINNYRCV